MFSQSGLLSVRSRFSAEYRVNRIPCPVVRIRPQGSCGRPYDVGKT